MHYAPSDLALHYLLMFLLWDSRRKWVNVLFKRTGLNGFCEFNWLLSNKIVQTLTRSQVGSVASNLGRQCLSKSRVLEQ